MEPYLWTLGTLACLGLLAYVVCKMAGKPVRDDDDVEKHFIEGPWREL